jgi:hypothetical protein
MAEFIDINDLGLEDEPLGDNFDATANSFSGPPPLPKATFTVSVAFREKDPGKQWAELAYNEEKGFGPGKYLATKLVLTVLDGEHEKRRIFDDFVSTGVWNGSTSTIASILHLLGRGDDVVRLSREGKGHMELARLFSQAIASEPTLRVAVDWEGRVKNEETGKYETLYKTMTEFPQRKDGTNDPVIRDENDTTIGQARLKVKRYYAAPTGAGAVA